MGRSTMSIYKYLTWLENHNNYVHNFLARWLFLEAGATHLYFHSRILLHHLFIPCSVLPLQVVWCADVGGGDLRSAAVSGSE